MDDTPKPPSPIDRLRSELEFAADHLLRETPKFKRDKARLVNELARTAKRAMRGKAASRTPEQRTAEDRFKSDPMFNPNKPHKVKRQRDTRRRNMILHEEM